VRRPHGYPAAVINLTAWEGRDVLVTGHTGFKGSWLCLWLQSLGARVTGLSWGVPTAPSLYELARVGDGMAAEFSTDVRDAAAVREAIAAARPSVVLHLAAQPLVRRSFVAPVETYAVNVMGTVNVLDAVRLEPGVQAVVVVTSDKCYDNREQRRPFQEDDPMGGHDPYSNSKGCAELVVDAYRRSFFSGNGKDAPRLGSARAGNVIGGGDWGEGRLIPDIMRAALGGSEIAIRSPEAVRPWQHVLNPLMGYLLLAEALLDDPLHASGWNFGPADDDVRPVRWIVDRLTELWPADLRWAIDPGPHVREAGWLALDSTKAREHLGWVPAWELEEALRRIVSWYRELQAGADMRWLSLDQIGAFTTASVAA